MATWNNPTDVSTGTALTATLWNNLLGTNGSLKYVYDNITTSNIVLYKSTDTVFASTTIINIAFDTIITDYAGQQVNFPVTVPITDIPLPLAGMYMATFQQSGNASATVRTNFNVNDGTNTYRYVSTIHTQANPLYTHTALFYAPASSTVRLSINSTAQTINATAPSSSGGSQVLTIVRI